MLHRLASFLGYEKKSVSIDPALLAVLSGGGPTASGVNVGPETALRCAPVLACVRVISETVGGLPLVVYQRTDASKERAVEHPLYSLLHDAPNGWQSAAEFVTSMTAAMAVHGFAVAFIGRDGAGAPVELIQIASRSVSVEVDAATMEPSFVMTAGDGTRRTYARGDILYLALPGPEPWKPIAPVTLAREAIGLSLTLEAHCASLFGRGAKPSGILRVKRKMTDETLKKLRVNFSNVYSGPGGERTAILEEDQEFQQLQLSSVDSQLLELRRFAVAEISRVWRVPMHLLSELERATWSNAETQNREFVAFTLKPYLEAWEGAVRLALIDPADRGQVFAEFLTEDLLRGDTAARFAAYQSALLSGWMTVNEIRSLENRAPVDGGDVIRTPVNTAPAASPMGTAQ